MWAFLCNFFPFLWNFLFFFPWSTASVVAVCPCKALCTKLLGKLVLANLFRRACCAPPRLLCRAVAFVSLCVRESSLRVPLKCFNLTPLHWRSVIIIASQSKLIRGAYVRSFQKPSGRAFRFSYFFRSFHGMASFNCRRGKLIVELKRAMDLGASRFLGNCAVVWFFTIFRHFFFWRNRFLFVATSWVFLRGAK